VHLSDCGGEEPIIPQISGIITPRHFGLISSINIRRYCGRRRSDVARKSLHKRDARIRHQVDAGLRAFLWSEAMNMMPANVPQDRNQRGAEGQTQFAKSLTLAAMSLGFGVVQLDVTIVNTALSSIGASLGGISDLQWVVSAYTIAFAALILTAGTLGDRTGAKRIFIAGFAVFTFASAACAFAPNAWILIVARAIQGAGAAILIPNSLALLNHSYPDETQRGRAVGIWAAGASLALTAGPLAGGGLVALVGWRSIFFVNLPIGLIGLWLTWRYAGETPRSPQRHIDLPGQGAAIGALGCLAAAIIEAGVVGWTDIRILLGFVACAALALLFILRECRTPQPMLPLAFFRRKTFSAAALVGLLVNAAFYGIIFVLSLYFQQINGLSPLATGLAFLPMMAAVLIVNLFAARAAERLGTNTAIVIGAAVAALGCIGLVWIDYATDYAKIAWQMVAMGGGLGLIVPPLTSMLLGSVEKANSGVAAGVLNATRQTGSVLGVALFGSLVSHKNVFVAGTRMSLLISAILFLSAATIAYLGTAKRGG
jgi:MFS transporter, DHA2 family, methylenomycin A resistance protein